MPEVTMSAAWSIKSASPNQMWWQSAPNRDFRNANLPEALALLLAPCKGGNKVVGVLRDQRGFFSR